MSGRWCYDAAPMEGLYILDGMALMYRAFYAFIHAPMRTAGGLNTSAMFGFANTLLSLIEKENPTHLAACLDPSGPTFRHERYEAYKANRQAMPQELRDSIPWIVDMLAAMRIPTVRVPGYEADDLIGTLTLMAERQPQMHTYMVSADKDLGQLLSPSCSFLRPGRKGGDFEVVRQEDFLKEWGLESPRQMIDLLALMGDTSDNIPGVPGVGTVTARKLIAQFGSLEAMLSRTSEIRGKLRQKIEEHADSARLSYELATIRRDAPMPLSLADCAWSDVDREALCELFTRLEFRGLVKKISGQASQGGESAAPGGLFAQERRFEKEEGDEVGEKSETEDTGGAVHQLDLFAEPSLSDIHHTPHQYDLVQTEEERQALASRLLSCPRWAFDTETTGLNPLEDRLLGISFCMEARHAYYVPIDGAEALAPFRAVFAGEALKVGLNVKFDLEVLRMAGLEVRGPFFDVMLAHTALFPELRHNMDDMAEALLSYRTVRLEEIAGKEMDTAAVPIETMADYAAEDADITLQLAQALEPKLEAAGQDTLLQRIEFPLISVLADIELEGMRVEPEQLRRSSAALGEQIEALRARIDSIIGRPINLNSPRQLGDLLFGEMKLLARPRKTRTGQYVTDEETLRKLVPVSPLVGDILEYRELSKLRSTYLEALPRFISPRDGRIHSTLLQMVTATGRLASQNPNLQNIPVRSEAGKLIRRAFVARDENFCILSADYSQVELRLMAALSEDPGMMAAFTHGRDIHAETASRIYGVPHEEVTSDMRRAAKTVNFGIIYGISAFGLSQRLDCSRGEAAALIESYFAQFPGVKACMDRLVQEAREKGYAETLCGRRRYLPDIASANFNLRAAAERTAINTPIQGSAADMIKIAMIRVAQLLRGRRSRLIMQIHDELLLDLHLEEKEELIPLVVEAMRTALPLPGGVPLEVEANTADNWLDAH